MAGVWDSATFVWNPGSAVLASFNEVDSADAAGLTEGPFVTSPIAGRTYTTSQGSRFDTIPAASPEIDGWTSMAVVSAATGKTTYCLWAGDRAITNEYTSFTWNGDDGLTDYDARAAGGSKPAANWAGGLAGNPRFADFAEHTVVVRGTKADLPSAGYFLVEVFVDGGLVNQSRQLITNEIDVKTITIGAFDRSSPSWGSGGAVHAAAFWPLSITDAEVQAISYDPHSYPTAPAGYFYKPDEFTDEWAGLKFFWTPDQDQISGIDVVQGAISDHNKITPANVDVTKETLDGKIFGNREQFTMDLGLPLGADPVTMMLLSAQTDTSGEGKFALARNPDTNAYYWIARGTGEMYYHMRNTTGVSTNGSSSDTTAITCFVATATYAGTTVSVETFTDAIGNKTAGSATVSNANSIKYPQNISVGGIGDGSPGNGTKFEVFAAAIWDRQLSDAEITAVLADPLGALAQVPVFSGGSGGGGLATVEYGDTLLRYLQDQGATSKEIVGALNELNSTTGVEFDLAYRTYFA